MDITEVGDHAEALPGVRRRERDGLLRWSVDQRLVARQADPDTVVIRSDFGEREALLEAHPETFSVPPRLEGHQSVLADLTHGDPAAIRAAVTAAWELQCR